MCKFPSAQFKIKGFDWPKTLDGGFELMGPVNNLGAWRWHEHRYQSGTTVCVSQIKIDSTMEILLFKGKLVQHSRNKK